MDYYAYNHRLFAGFALMILLFAGCAPRTRTQVEVCKREINIDELLSLLSSRSENTSPLKASGHCFLQYYAKENKLKKENFPIKLWLNPTAELYMQGDVAFDPKGITLGSNEHEFWLAMKPKKISSYWWGRWSDGNGPERLIVNPKLVLEALGLVTADNVRNWFLLNEGAYYILTKRIDNTKTKKIYIDNCDYLVRRVEYLDSKGQAIITMELDKYKEPAGGFFVPSRIKIINYRDGSEHGSARIDLGSIKSTTFTERQKWHLFARPQTKGFQHIYKIIGGDIIEQPQ